MGKITGLEDIGKVPPKVEKLYGAVRQLIQEGADVANVKVSSLTQLAGIGKGTAYEYFDTKEEIVACAVVYHVAVMMDWLRLRFHEKSSFEESLDFVLDELEMRNCRMQAFSWFVHMLTDNTEISRLIREKMHSEEFARYEPVNFFRSELEERRNKGELRSDQPLDYQVYVLFSHLVVYMMAVYTKKNSQLDMGTLRPFVRKGILRELCEKEEEKDK